MRQHQPRFESVSTVCYICNLGTCSWEVLREGVSGLALRTRCFAMLGACRRAEMTGWLLPYVGLQLHKFYLTLVLKFLKTSKVLKPK